MLVIRFLRVGKKNQPSFKIVVTDKRKPPRSGRFVEEVGFYNPLTKEKVLKKERIKYWMSVGAKPSNIVYNLLVKEKILEGEKIPVHKKPKEKAKKKPEEGKVKEVKKEEKPAKEAKAEEKPPEKAEIPEETKRPKEEKPSSASVSAKLSADKKAMEDKPSEKIEEKKA
ncbi:30S ribosomal protein S16 [Patescibacteria group bacterium]|nr:30S ribosomal protein S16 [Patescibacteria group bacterium]